MASILKRFNVTNNFTVSSEINYKKRSLFKEEHFTLRSIDYKTRNISVEVAEFTMGIIIYYRKSISLLEAESIILRVVRFLG